MSSNRPLDTAATASAALWPSSLERYQSIIHNAVEGIFQSTPDGHYLLVNPALARMYGYDSPEQLLNSVSDISQTIYVDAEARCEYQRWMARDGEVRGLEYQVRRKDGGTIWVCEYARAVRNDRGEILYYEGFIQDVSRRKQAEAELRAAKEAAEAAAVAKTQFLAVVSHEIRTPMNGVLGMTSLLRNTGLTSEQRDFVETIWQSADSLLAVINDILDFAKTESGRLELEHNDFVLRDCLESVLMLLRPKATEKGLVVWCDVAENTPLAVCGDVTRLRQVLMNLLGNAIKFTERGEVRLSVRPAPAADGKLSLHFAVSDTGIGIAADAVSRLFRPFSQADASTTRRYGGTGLGLATSKRLTELMGGEMSLESTAGRGSTFHFNILVDPAQRSAEPEVPEATIEAMPPETIGLPGARERVLLAEDNEVNRKVARHMLARLGFEVDIAVNGFEALAAAHMRRYDIILMDVHMPEMDGLEATRALRGEASPRHRPWIIALTANAMQGDRDVCLDAGMDDYITKPLNPGELAAAMRKARAAVAA